MLENFKGISFSHRNMPLEAREKLALNDEETRQLLKHFKEYSDFEDIFVLSTCNRIEIYYSHSDNKKNEILKILGVVKGNNLKSLSDFGYEFKTGQDAIKHLFRVSMGLKSQVIGDIQVISQVKKAYQISADENTAGPFLHRLMHTIFLTNKRVSQETKFKDGAASLSYAAVDLIKRESKIYSNPKILKVGLGEIGIDVVDNLRKWFSNVTLINRTIDKSNEVASKNGYRVAPYENLDEEISAADIIISSVSSSSSILDKNSIALDAGKKIVIDLSVPRSIHPELVDQEIIRLFNIDDLKQTTSKSLEKRKKSIPQVEQIINESINQLSEWSKEAEIYPTINKLKASLEELRKDELKQYLKELDPDQLEMVDKITRGLIQKIIKYPVLHLKAACQRDDAESLAEILSDLFDLESQKVK